MVLVFCVLYLVQFFWMTYCYHWLSFSQDLVDQDAVLTKLTVNKYLWEKIQEQEPAEEEPSPEPAIDLNELD